MVLIFIDEFVTKDTIIGPMPNLVSSFDNFFVWKCSELLDLNDSLSKKHQNKVHISLNDDLNWMHQISLANNIQLQNLEIIYNNHKVFFKTTKEILKGDSLMAFPSKDLEISLGLQYVPFDKDGFYCCKKCSKEFSFQYHLMLHVRYFCSLNLKQRIANQEISQKRKMNDLENQNKIQKTDIFDSINDKQKHHKQQSNHFFTYLQNLVYSNFMRRNQTMNLEDFTKQQMTNQFMSNFYLKQVNNNLETYANKINYFQRNLYKINETKPQTSKTAEKMEIFDDLETNFIQDKNAKKDSTNLNQILNSQPIQNWCAKCNSHFRLTSDLVYHMRTFHRKDEQEKSPIANILTHQNRHDISSEIHNQERSFKFEKLTKVVKNSRENKIFKCDICQETFKEKHHLSRHMTSHR